MSLCKVGHNAVKGWVQQQKGGRGVQCFVAGETFMPYASFDPALATLNPTISKQIGSGSIICPVGLN